MYPIVVFATIQQRSNSNMKFKTDKTMVAQELGRIAGTQHKYMGIRNASGARSRYSKPLDFDVWFNRGLEVYKGRGYKFQWLNLTTLKVTLPNGKIGTRTYEDFYQEWETEYKPQSPSCF